MENSIDSVKLNFSEDALWGLNIALAVVMFGVALGLTTQDFVRIVKAPKSALLGVLSQFVVLPALTFLLVYIFEPTPSIALGMILVAACPGGNISNFMSQISGGNSALSVTLTAFATLLAIFFTPFNLSFWGGLYPPTQAILEQVSINPIDVFKTVALILAAPLVAGMLVRRWKPKTAEVISKVLKPLSILIFVALVILAFSNNIDLFKRFIGQIILLVFLHNAIALSCGYYLGKLGKLPIADRRTLAVETGIQNSGLGLLLIFSFFDGLGGMAIIAGWWGIWHIVAGLTMAFWWSKRKIKHE